MGAGQSSTALPFFQRIFTVFYLEITDHIYGCEERSVNGFM